MNSLAIQIGALVMDDTRGDSRPTAYAHEGVLAFLDLLGDIPQGTVSTDQSGAIYVAWHNGGKRIQLTHPPNAKLKPYIYYRHGEDNGLVTDCSPDQLAERLEWLRS
jgi:hypothetical protein